MTCAMLASRRCVRGRARKRLRYKAKKWLNTRTAEQMTAARLAAAQGECQQGDGEQCESGGFGRFDWR
jgi:hypothetical protein